MELGLHWLVVLVVHACLFLSASLSLSICYAFARKHPIHHRNNQGRVRIVVITSF